jgi:predicted aspartyl protease
MKGPNKSKFLILIVALLGSLTPLVSGQERHAQSVQFKLLRSYLIVLPVIVNDAGPYEFLLDTGTNTTLVSTEFARQLRLRPIDRIELVTAAGAQIVPRAQLASITVGGQRAEDVEVLFSALHEVRAIKPEIVGVLGQNFLAQHNYLIDYRARQIMFMKEEALERQLCGEHLPIEWHEGRAIITVGKNRGRLVLDSATATLLFFDIARRGLTLDWDQTAPQWLQARSDLGSRLVQQRRLRNFNVGGVRFYDLPAALCAMKDEGRVEDGLLPTSLFHKIYFNHRQSFVIFNPR